MAYELSNSLKLSTNLAPAVARLHELTTYFSQISDTLKCCARAIQQCAKDGKAIGQFLRYPNHNAALIVVDFQWDFVCGTLRTDTCPARQNGVNIVDKVNWLAQLPYGKTFVSYDWHPANHISFHENRMSITLSKNSLIKCLEEAKIYDVVTVIDSHGNEREQKLWPAHCIAGTDGAKLYDGIQLPDSAIPIYKGTISDVESYSVFGDPHGLEDTGLLTKLRQHGIRLLIFCGIAFDVCVASSALNAAKLGFLVVVVEDACVGISPEDIATKRAELIEAGVYVTQSENIPALLAGEFVPLPHAINLIQAEPEHEKVC